MRFVKRPTPGDHVFISYAREDADRLEDVLLGPLRDHGIPYWYDKHIEWDASWWRDDVRPRLKGSHAVVVLMTPASAVSPWVLREITVATESGRPIFPVLVEGEGLADLADRQHLSVVDDEVIPDAWFAALHRRVQRGRGVRISRMIGRASIVVLSVVAAVIAIVQFLVPLLTTETEPLPTFATDYGIGVADFPIHGEDSPREQAAAEVASFQPRLVAGIDAVLSAAEATALDVIAPSVEVLAIPRAVEAPTTEKVDEEARGLLADSGADILVHGTIEIDGARLVARPRLYLASLPRAEELTGPHLLPPIDQDISDPVGAQLLREQIAELGADLGRLTQVVRFYDTDRLEQGVDYIDQIRDDVETGASGVLAIFEGNMLGKLGRFAEAAAAYERALENGVSVDRAQLGLTQARYSEVLGSSGWCSADTDLQQMEMVINAYRDIGAAPPDDGSNIAAKARFGEGRALLCLETADLIPASEGRRLLDTVIAEYTESGSDGDLRELAAESEGILGFVEAQEAADDEARAAALRRLDRAIELTVFTERAVSFRRAKVDALAAAGDLRTACDEIDQIEILSPDSPVDELRVELECP